MITIGIDPGKTGAVAIFDGGWTVVDCPTVTAKIGKSIKQIPDPGLMSEILRPYAGRARVALEKVHAMPGQGVSSMFSFGTNYGIWQGIVAAFEMPITLVTPQSWKKAMLAGMGKGKDEARIRALQLFPALKSSLGRKRDIGRADALLIGEYGRVSVIG